jgi:hypothetical protein
MLQLVASKNNVMQEHYIVSLPALQSGTESLFVAAFLVTCKKKALSVDISKIECQHKHLNYVCLVLDNNFEKI